MNAFLLSLPLFALPKCEKNGLSIVDVSNHCVGAKINETRQMQGTKVETADFRREKNQGCWACTLCLYDLN
jgi:hypothetical protein